MVGDYKKNKNVYERGYLCMKSITYFKEELAQMKDAREEIETREKHFHAALVERYEEQRLIEAEILQLKNQERTSAGEDTLIQQEGTPVRQEYGVLPSYEEWDNNNEIEEKFN